jgi:hypothetical protein
MFFFAWDYWYRYSFFLCTMCAVLHARRSSLFSPWINCPIAIHVQLWDTLPFSLPELSLLLLGHSLSECWTAKLLLCLWLFLHVWVAHNVSLVAFFHLKLVCAVLHTWFSSQPQTSMDDSGIWIWFESPSAHQELFVIRLEACNFVWLRVSSVVLCYTSWSSCCVLQSYDHL